MECRMEGITFRECTTQSGSELKENLVVAINCYPSKAQTMQLFQLKGCKLTLLSIAAKNKLMFYPEMYKLHAQDLHRLPHQRGNVPEIHTANKRLARRGLGFSWAQSPACARGTPPPEG